MGLSLRYEYGQTPLADEELDGLRINSIGSKAELDEHEHQNIEEAIFWLRNKNLSTEKILSENFIKQCHRKMFGSVWSWAGEFRKTDKNIGIPFYEIPMALKLLTDDALFQVANNVYPPDEMALYFKHRLVSIHCFANGNGRHSRLMADIIIEKIYQQEVFSWGSKQPKNSAEYLRKEYIQAVKACDRGDFSALLNFARK